MIKRTLLNYSTGRSHQTMEAGADNIGLVPMQMGGVLLTACRCIRVDQIHEESRLRGVKMV